MQKPKYEKITGKYKYRLLEDHFEQTPFTGMEISIPGYVDLSRTGMLRIHKGYAWDGATGVPDTEHILRGSLSHDVFSQMMREGKFPVKLRKNIDSFLVEICHQDGMSPFFCHVVYAGVRMFGWLFTRPKASS